MCITIGTSDFCLKAALSRKAGSVAAPEENQIFIIFFEYNSP
jgi:hypothetical protein